MGQSAVPALLAALKSNDTDKRFAAADVLVRMQRSAPESVVPLMSALEEDNLKFVATNYAFYIRLGQLGTEEVLIRALNKYARATRLAKGWSKITSIVAARSSTPARASGVRNMATP